MKKCDEIQGILIDEFYGKEVDINTKKHIENCPECMKYRNKLYAASEKLDILEIVNLSMPADLLNIINRAGDIKEKEKKRHEIFFFVLASLCILTPFAGLGLYFGLKPLLYMQVILYLNMPLVIIPLIINRKIKGEER